MKVVNAPKRSTKQNQTKELNETVIIKRKPQPTLILPAEEKVEIEDRPVKQTVKHKNVVDVNSLVAEHRKDNNRVKNFNLPKMDNAGLRGNIIDNYLGADADASNPYAKIIAPRKQKRKEQLFEYAFPEPNETGYDYKDALHPQEELDEIMKAFDFYRPVEE